MKRFQLLTAEFDPTELSVPLLRFGTLNFDSLFLQLDFLFLADESLVAFDAVAAVENLTRKKVIKS